MDGGRIQFFNKDGSLSKRNQLKASIDNCIKCGGTNSKVMFTIEYMGDKDNE